MVLYRVIDLFKIKKKRWEENKNTCKYQLSHCLKLLLKLKQLDMGLLMMCSLFYADSSIPSCVKSFLSPESHWLISFNVYFVSCQVVCVCVACSYSQLVPVPILSGIDFLSQAFASHPQAQGKCWHRARTRNGLMCQHDLSGWHSASDCTFQSEKALKRGEGQGWTHLTRSFD